MVGAFHAYSKRGQHFGTWHYATLETEWLETTLNKENKFIFPDQYRADEKMLPV